jgi:predicted acyltransferase
VPASRFVFLDAFRGSTIAAMVLVNNPGTWAAVYPPLRHAEWHGLTPTDVIFPFFLFIVGVAIPLSQPRPGRVLRRAAVVFALGLLLNVVGNPDLATLRIPGVLQRIALCYAAAAVLHRTTSWRTQSLVTATLLLGYWAALTLVPVPGFGRGVLTPEGNLAAWIDRAVLGPHVWKVSRVYDPEGILSTLPAIATTLVGVLAGAWLRSGRTPRAISMGFAWTGMGSILVGAAWSVAFPMNKSLWTSSYVLVTAGLALIIFAVCYQAIDVHGRRAWAAPFVVFGVNALALYFLSTLAAILLARTGARRWMFEHALAPWASPVNASLAYAIAYLLVWWVIVWGLYRGGVRLRA